MGPKITKTEYGTFQKVYDFLNAELFDGTLPNVLVTLQRQRGTRGYFWAGRFRDRNRETTAHEIALNPDTFPQRTDKDIISTLAHEMVHVWQETYGKSGRGRYHNREWARRMKDIGLQPSDTGLPGGKETGESVSHYVIPKGPFAEAYRKLEIRGIHLNWQAAPVTLKWAKEKKASKTKFTCPMCYQNAWAKADSKLRCGVCDGTEMLKA